VWVVASQGEITAARQSLQLQPHPALVLLKSTQNVWSSAHALQLVQKMKMQGQCQLWKLCLLVFRSAVHAGCLSLLQRLLGCAQVSLLADQTRLLLLLLLLGFHDGLMQVAMVLLLLYCQMLARSDWHHPIRNSSYCCCYCYCPLSSRQYC
jgi:hypothetical protein